MKISDGKYNNLYDIAENALQASWRDLGLSSQDVIKLSEKNPEFCGKDSVLPPCYFLYRKHALYIVNNILKELDIKVEEV